MIRFVLSRASSALIMCAVIACGGDDGKETSSEATPDEDGGTAEVSAEDAAPPKPEPVAYDDTEDALVRMFEDLVVALTAPDQEAKATRLVHSFILPDYETWFTEMFGKGRTTRRLIKKYAKVKSDIGSLGVTLRAESGTGRTKVEVGAFSKDSSDGAIGYQLKALEAAKKPLKLYSVRLTSEDGKKSFHVWSFVHVDGTFRYLGKLKDLVPNKKREKSPTSGRELLEFTAADAERLVASESPDAGPP